MGARNLFRFNPRPNHGLRIRRYLLESPLSPSRVVSDAPVADIGGARRNILSRSRGKGVLPKSRSATVSVLRPVAATPEYPLLSRRPTPQWERGIHSASTPVNPPPTNSAMDALFPFARWGERPREPFRVWSSRFSVFPSFIQISTFDIGHSMFRSILYPPSWLPCSGFTL